MLGGGFVWDNRQRTHVVLVDITVRFRLIPDQRKQIQKIRSIDFLRLKT
jgi:hypothetical protein